MPQSSRRKRFTTTTFAQQVGSYDCDVLIVGSGIMGACVARLLRESSPDLSIIMVEGGPVVGSMPGQHLHDAPEQEIRDRFNRRAAAGNQALYVGISRSADGGPGTAGTEPGMHSLAAVGSDADEMPGGSVAWNVGGMGAHWAAASPGPYGTEVIGFLPAHEWAADLETSKRLLNVHAAPFGSNPAAEAVHAALNEIFGPVSKPGRHVQAMPMAATVDEKGRIFRTGPSAIFPPLALGGDENFELRANTLALRIEHDAGYAGGATTRDTLTGSVSTISARATVVCADTLRTPQLLWASDIRPWALGRFLNEHAFLSGHVTLDPSRLGSSDFAIPTPPSGEWATAATWLPYSGDDQPFHGQIMQSPSATENGYDVGLALYIPTEVNADNRVEFSTSEVDDFGLPRMSLRFSYSDRDLQLIERARKSQRLAGERLGDFDSERDSLLLPPGSSLHYTGTVRMGQANNGDSVCNPDTLVWDFKNLFVAGNGVIPTALACNSTLTGAITAVRSARSVLRFLNLGDTELST